MVNYPTMFDLNVSSMNYACIIGNTDKIFIFRMYKITYPITINTVGDRIHKTLVISKQKTVMWQV